MTLDPVIEPEELRSLPDALLFDVRTGPAARDAYAKEHVAGAQFVDLDKDLSDKPADAASGGRHPLPDVRTFARRVGEWGITPSSHVVVYDDANGANAAARLWWMLRALGHQRVQLLNGGLSAARVAQLALTSEVPQPAPVAPYPTSGWQFPTVDIDEVDQARADREKLVLDVRAAMRFRGEQEPIDPVAGHIPGAANLPLSENLREDGRFKSAEELHKQYLLLLGDRAPSSLIVHCGSGVTACHTLVALERAGLRGARLYVGSWSEWCRNPDRPRNP